MKKADSSTAMVVTAKWGNRFVKNLVEKCLTTKKGMRSLTGCDQLSMILIMTSGGVASNRSAIHFTNILLKMID
jgi:hypothetical protein